jgi:chromosome segregation ATPase
MEMNALAAVLALTSTLVLHSGDRIAAEGAVSEVKGVVMFRSGGVLYSMPAVEIARIEKGDGAEPEKKPVRKLAVSEEQRKRLIEELQNNHSGKPAPKQATLEKMPPAPSREEVAEEKREEQAWRRDARAYEEAVLRAREELQLLQNRIEELRGKIQSLVSLGYKPHQFTYDSAQLIRAQEQIPAAELEIARAERALVQFREDARKEGVPPGWLR